MKGNHFFHVQPSDKERMSNLYGHREPLMHTNQSQVFELLSDDLAERLSQASHGGIVLEERMALMYTGQWSNVNLFHLINDLLAGVGHVWLTFPEIEQVPTRVVYVVNTTFNTKWRKRHCEACVEWGDSFSLPRASQQQRSCASSRTVVIDNLVPLESPDNPMRCFCGAAVMYHHELPFHSAERSAAYRNVKQHLARWFGLGEYDLPASSTFLQGEKSFWFGCQNSQPKLLVIDRRGTRRLLQVGELVNLSTQIGFCVRVARFEAMSGCQQFAASRSADVMMSVHGMALAAMLAMNGTAPLTTVEKNDLDAAVLVPTPGASGSLSRKKIKSCRTVIELMHWVRPNDFWFYKELAYVNNLTLLREIPVDVVFGRSVLHKEKEKKLLMKNTFWWGLKGFDDQTPIYDLSSVDKKLRYAFSRARFC